MKTNSSPRFTSRFKKSKTAFTLFLLTSACSLHANTVLLSDSFDDGGITNGADALDTAWYDGRQNVNLSAYDVGSDNSPLQDFTLQAYPENSKTFRLFVGSFSTGTIGVGEMLTLEFDMYFPWNQNSNTTGFRFGLHHDGGSSVSSNLTAESPTIYNDDEGYFVRVPSAGGASPKLFVEYGGDGSILMTGGSDNDELTNDSPGTIATFDDEKMTYRYEITRLSDSIVTTQLYHNDTIVGSATDSTYAFNSFNQVVFGWGSLGASVDRVRLDNITVTVGAIPEPAEYATIVSIVASLLLIRRRLSR